MSDLSPFGLTRDSAVLWLAALAAGFGYLTVMPPPTDWSYAQWLQVSGAAVLYVLGVLKTSPLKGEND